MKIKLSFVMFMLLVIGSGCTIYDDCVSPEDIESIHGSSVIISQNRILPDFHSVHINTAGEVSVLHGTEQSVDILADSSLMQYISTTVNNGILIIDIKKGVHLSHFDLKMNITMTDLEELATNSAGSISGKNKFKADVVCLKSSSAGDIRLELEADQLYSILSSAGDIRVNGSAKTHHAIVSSAGNLHAFDLFTETTYVTVSSAGNAAVNASQFLNAIISSIGSVFYKGSPAISLSISSKGQLIDAN